MTRRLSGDQPAGFRSHRLVLTCLPRYIADIQAHPFSLSRSASKDLKAKNSL
jgi:hypothetical protein